MATGRGEDGSGLRRTVARLAKTGAGFGARLARRDWRETGRTRDRPRGVRGVGRRVTSRVSVWPRAPRRPGAASTRSTPSRGALRLAHNQRAQGGLAAAAATFDRCRRFSSESRPLARSCTQTPTIDGRSSERFANRRLRWREARSPFGATRVPPRGAGSLGARTPRHAPSRPPATSSNPTG